MDDSPLFSPPDSGVAELREQVQSLRHLVKLLLVAAFIASSAMVLFLYRQSTLLKRQIDQQQRALAESVQQEREVVLKGITQFRAYGTRDPYYATNVLAKFGLTPGLPTNAPAASSPK